MPFAAKVCNFAKSDDDVQLRNGWLPNMSLCVTDVQSVFLLLALSPCRVADTAFNTAATTA
jgi:hypothetical protein